MTSICFLHPNILDFSMRVFDCFSECLGRQVNEAVRIVPKFHYVLFCFGVHSLCSYCLSFQFLFTLSLFNSLTVSLLSFLTVSPTSQ